VLFDKEGNASTVGTYNNYISDPATGVLYPHLIKIERPQEQYTMQLGVVAVKINVAMTNEQFQLPRPEGSELQVLDNVTPGDSVLKGDGPPKGSRNR
jgi:hypothetical protein